jgi:hypothetical protein
VEHLSITQAISVRKAKPSDLDIFAGRIREADVLELHEAAGFLQNAPTCEIRWLAVGEDSQAATNSKNL